MRTSTVLRRAAEYVAKRQAEFRVCCCCPAVEGVYCHDGVATIQEVVKAQALFEKFFKPEGLNEYSVWWGVCDASYDLDWFTMNQDARVIALLLAAEIAKEVECKNVSRTKYRLRA